MFSATTVGICLHQSQEYPHLIVVEKQELDKVEPSNAMNCVETNVNVASQVLLLGEAKYEVLTSLKAL